MSATPLKSIKDYVADIDKETYTAYKAKRILEEVCQRDLVAFTYIVLPHYTNFVVKDEEVDSTPSPAHYILSDFLLKIDNSMVLSLPRELGKSSYISVFYLCHNLIFTKKRFIVFIGSSAEKANNAMRNFLMEVIDLDTKEVRQDTIFSLYVKSVYFKLTDNNVGTIIITKTDGSEIYIKVAGRKVNLRGLRIGKRRPELVLTDDVEDASISRINDKYNENSGDWFLSDILPLGQAAKIVLCGTKIAEGSLLNVFTENPPKQVLPGHAVPMEYSVLDLGYRSAYNGGSIWEGKYTAEALDVMEEYFASRGKSEIFDNEYLSKVSEDKTNIFDKQPIIERSYDAPTNPQEWVNTEWHIILASKWNRYMYSDLATKTQSTTSGAKPKNCYTSILEVGIESDGTWRIHDAHAGVWDPFEYAEKAIISLNKWSPMRYYVESGTTYNTMIPVLKKLALDNQLYVEHLITPMPSASDFDGKFDRIIGNLRPNYRVGKIRLNQRAQAYPLILDEFEQGRRCKHIDLLDAMAMIYGTAIIPESLNTDIFSQAQHQQHRVTQKKHRRLRP